MGKLRLEPLEEKMNSELFDQYAELLEEARRAGNENRIYYDLEKGEKPAKVKKDMLYVAEQKKINLSVRRPRGSSTLELIFDGSEEPSGKRMPADEARKRIVDAIKNAGEPVDKATVVAEAGISPGTWNLRIRELVGDGTVVRVGQRREARYKLA